jgi:hypothetical protein
MGPALKSAVHIRLLAHEDDLLVSHCAGQQHEQPRPLQALVRAPTPQA